MTYTLLDWGTLAVSVASVALGLVIGYQAYRGFRRNDSRSMQYLSLGLILLTAVPFTLTFGVTLLVRVEPSLASVQEQIFFVVRLIQFAGLALITVSLYEKP
jgi:predicted anti-sigma-YlaC factor YlaD